MTKDCLKEIAPYLNAANVDLKFFKDSSYRKICFASLGPVLDSIKLIKDLGIWVEITTLVIPGLNETNSELQKISRFIASIDKNIPWHISRFFPMYKMKNKEITSRESLKKAYEMGKKVGLKNIFLGNV